MASAVTLTKSFVSWAHRNGGSEILRQNHDRILAESLETGGKTLVNSTLNGKSFSFQLPSSLDPSELLPVLMDAANLYDEKNADGTLAEYIASRRVTRTALRFA